MPWGVQVPLRPQIRRAGPSSSKPRSQLYLATVPAGTGASDEDDDGEEEAGLELKSTVECAGAPGKPQDALAGKERERISPLRSFQRGEKGSKGSFWRQKLIREWEKSRSQTL